MRFALNECKGLDTLILDLSSVTILMQIYKYEFVKGCANGYESECKGTVRKGVGELKRGSNEKER